MFGDFVALVLGYFGHRLAFGKILPNEPVGVLIGIREIAFGFSAKRGSGSILTVIIPITHIGPRHRALIHVTFDQGLRIIGIAEVPQI
jgi:hypothetical protein